QPIEPPEFGGHARVPFGPPRLRALERARRRADRLRETRADLRLEAAPALPHALDEVVLDPRAVREKKPFEIRGGIPPDRVAKRSGRPDAVQHPREQRRLSHREQLRVEESGLRPESGLGTQLGRESLGPELGVLDETPEKLVAESEEAFGGAAIESFGSGLLGGEAR